MQIGMDTYADCRVSQFHGYFGVYDVTREVFSTGFGFNIVTIYYALVLCYSLDLQNLFNIIYCSNGSVSIT